MIKVERAQFQGARMSSKFFAWVAGIGARVFNQIIKNAQNSSEKDFGFGMNQIHIALQSIKNSF